MRTFLLFLLLLMPPVISAEAGETSEAVYPPIGVDMPLKQVSRHVYYVEGTPGVATDNEGFISNAAFVVTGAGVVVFDALGSPSLANALLAKIRSVTEEPIVRVIVSHYHADHIYGLQVFEELGAEILAPAGAETYLASQNAKERLEERRFTLDPWVNETTRLVHPDRYLSEGTNFRLGDVDFIITMVGAAHSDGDVALHALCDALLGAAARGDIGQHFPPTDSRWAGADSRDLLAAVVALLDDSGWRVVNVDLTLVCERPRIGPHVPAMRAAIAPVLGVDKGAVSVKATTTERLGFCGRNGVSGRAARNSSLSRGTSSIAP